MNFIDYLSYQMLDGLLRILCYIGPVYVLHNVLQGLHFKKDANFFTSQYQKIKIEMTNVNSANIDEFTLVKSPFVIWIISILISFWQLNANCQIIIKDSLPEYELLLDKLPKFLERNIVNWQGQSEQLSENKYEGFGVLSIDSIGTYDVILNFSYYHEGVVFKECAQKAWGICYIGKTPILLCGMKDNRILYDKNRIAVFTRREDTFNGLIDPVYIRIRLKLNI